MFVITCLFPQRVSVAPQITANTKSVILSINTVNLTSLFKNAQVQLPRLHIIRGPPAPSQTIG